MSWCEKSMKIDNVLLKLGCPLSSSMPISFIELANVAVWKAMMNASCVTKVDETDGDYM